MSQSNIIVLSFGIFLAVVLSFVAIPELSAEGTQLRAAPGRVFPPPQFANVQSEPTVTRSIVPVYRELARKAGVSGDVRVKVWVGKNGKPREAYVLAFGRNTGDPKSHLDNGNGKDGIVVSRGFRVPFSSFEQPAMNAALKYGFRPAIAGGRPVGVWAIVLFTSAGKVAGPQVGDSVTQEKPVAVSYAQGSSDTSAPPPDFVPIEKEPQIIKQAVPKYPESAVKDHVEGKVIVKLWIAVNGRPHEAVVLRSTNDIFNRPAIGAAMRYRFTPAIMNNRPVAVWVVIPFTFKLHPDSGPAPGRSHGIVDADVRAKIMKLSSEISRLTELIFQYNRGMSHERAREYRKAAEDYRLFLEKAKDIKLNMDEMMRHAKNIVKKYSKMPNSGK